MSDKIKYSALNVLIVLLTLCYFSCSQPQSIKTTQEGVSAKGSRKPLPFIQVVSNLTEQISLSGKLDSTKNLAVLGFTNYDGISHGICQMLSDKITSNLIQQRIRFKTIDRSRIQSVIKELEFGLSGLISDESLKGIGRFLGADAVLTGIVNDLGFAYDIDLRMIETESGIVISHSSQLLDKKDPYIKFSVKSVEHRITSYYIYINNAIKFISRYQNMNKAGSKNVAIRCIENAIVEIEQARAMFPGSIHAQRLKEVCSKILKGEY